MRYCVYADATGWRWCLITSDDKELAFSGRSYPSRQECLDAVAEVKLSVDGPVAYMTPSFTPAVLSIAV